MAEDSELFARGLAQSISVALQDTPMVCLLGPRQSGKSTLVQQLHPERAYFDLDDEAFARRPSGIPSNWPTA